MESIINGDKSLFLFLNALGTDFWDPFWIAVTSKWTFVPAYIVLLVYVIKKYNWRQTLIFLSSLAILITVSDQTSNLFKRSFKRLRPCYDVAIQKEVRTPKGCGGSYSFFSAHASNNFALVLFLIMTLTLSWRYYLLLLAVIISYSRIYVGVHYPLDIFIGGLIGALYGWLIGLLCRRGMYRYS